MEFLKYRVNLFTPRERFSQVVVRPFTVSGVRHRSPVELSQVVIFIFCVSCFKGSQDGEKLRVNFIQSRGKVGLGKNIKSCVRSFRISIG